MKETVTENILLGMVESLNAEQQVKLRMVLDSAFKQVMIMPVESDERQREQANGELLQAFISAKKIEGCSDKTLYYNHSSIQE